MTIHMERAARPRLLEGRGRAEATRRRDHQRQLRRRGRRRALRRAYRRGHSGARGIPRERAGRGASGARCRDLAEIVHAEPGALVMRWVDGRTLDPAGVREPACLERILDTVGRCHREIPLHFRGPTPIFWVFQVVRDYARTLREDGSRMAGRIDEFLARAAHLESVVGPVEIVFGHNDLLAANFIDDGDRIWLIDWEYAGFNSPLFDLGGLAANNALDAGEEHRMLERYFGEPPGEARLASYAAMKCASALREAMWSMVSETRSEIDFDYVAYTGENLERFERAWEGGGVTSARDRTCGENAGGLPAAHPHPRWSVARTEGLGKGGGEVHLLHPAVPRDEHEHEDRRQIGERGEELGGNADPLALGVELEDVHAPRRAAPPTAREAVSSSRRRPARARSSPGPRSCSPPTAECRPARGRPRRGPPWPRRRRPWRSGSGSPCSRCRARPAGSRR